VSMKVWGVGKQIQGVHEHCPSVKGCTNEGVGLSGCDGGLSGGGE